MIWSQEREEIASLQRMRDFEMFKEWEGQEDKLHLEQEKLHSQIRNEYGGAKPIYSRTMLIILDPPPTRK